MFFFVEVINVTFLVSVMMLKRVGHPLAFRFKVCHLFSSNIDIFIHIDLVCRVNTCDDIQLQGPPPCELWLFCLSFIAIRSPCSWLHVCKLGVHLVKHDGFRVSPVSPLARWPYLKNIDSINMLDQMACHMPWMWRMFTLQELLEKIAGKVLHRSHIVETVPT